MQTVLHKGALLEIFWRNKLYVFNGWRYCKALCHFKFRQIERNGRKFSHIYRAQSNCFSPCWVPTPTIHLHNIPISFASLYCLRGIAWTCSPPGSLRDWASGPGRLWCTLIEKNRRKLKFQRIFTHGVEWNSYIT